ncbi:Transcriptional regulator, TetR family [Cystobacter fuscus DSM 2262]|uniref:Transcriptional regulator, TetR family n=1 Tax=Cystobacter fuscus (strain ATCC 25194 / DSM 2262 / NBRC 100088 / M29) TaxID=1242864 RepID=S9QIY4_CYSF2|nr:TetR/AcrR family transcriptional regulator [Cystobacter fuscus]EPX56428.1 Transcriptional regulator, TetR family [Cystobacter fuscus DSM 2262]
MARPKAFDTEEALDAAIGVFREHGFEGTSADMLVKAMGIGRQSLYDTFGDKWGVYCAAVRRYAAQEGEAHAAALRSRPRAIEGLRAMVERLVKDAGQACLGVGSICEFGRARADLAKIHDAAERALHGMIVERVRAAQADGDVGVDLKPEEAAGFLLASFAAIRIAARGGAKADQLRGLGRLALRALR